MNINQAKINAFQHLVYAYFMEHKRIFPWRETHDPYAILVSEVMSQQTQIDRVVPKYLAWLEKWPTIEHAANASLKEVLIMWSGLGYNRRAKKLYETCVMVRRDFKGNIPSETKALLSLPGIGCYTASAIQAFAFHMPVVALDTNIRCIYIHHFFNDKAVVRDDDLMPVIEATQDKDQPALWLSALMDYGAYLKQQGINPIAKSAGYTKQSPLKGSVREVRGFILKEINKGSNIHYQQLLKRFDARRVDLAWKGLIRDGLVKTVPDGESVLTP